MAAHRPPEHPSSGPRKAYVETYGCQMNIADGELMQGILAASGFAAAARPEDADVVLVNTCAIREHAEQRVLGRVGELARLKKERPGLVLGVTGCMAQRMGAALLERAGHVDLVMGPDAYRSLPDVLARLRPEPASAADGKRAGRKELPVLGAVAEAPGSEPERVAALDFAGEENYEGLEIRRTSRVSAWVPVQRGCDYRCTYCIVPYVRGPEKNREPERVLDEVRAIAAGGITEVVLLGQTVNSWKWGDWPFARLVRAVARVDGIRRVRFTSPHPNDLTDDLIAVMAEEPAVCKQLHLPVQAGHDRTLRRMLRRYSVAAYRERIGRVRAAMPGIVLTTDVIVAFPGETDAEYQATLDLLREIRFDDAYLYKFSEREGTPATRLPRSQFVPPAVAQQRLERVITLQRSISAEINASEVGRVVDVLVEREARAEGEVLGRTEGWKVATFRGDPSLIGRYVPVRLVTTTGATFSAERAGGPSRLGRVA
jgi:tRNA-2-methylthio-N6-dimethylallyladenosine synthase